MEFCRKSENRWLLPELFCRGSDQVFKIRTSHLLRTYDFFVKLFIWH